MIDLFPGETKEFLSYDMAINDTNNYYQPEFLNILLPNGVPPHRLVLKINYLIMLLRNLDPSDGLCNGSRMVCHQFSTHVIHAEITTGQYSGKHVFIPRIPLSLANDEGYPFKFVQKQFPVDFSIPQF
ncbi:uncharacterized protein LOC111405758 [Olea europaea var. sylvestris]|uniref:uncharacterized protein LOC111405758 n=1 Tax=Olea europaea var. sylvestris TaxID=158386 RepID=UPI000C1CF18C|nr:uncharacterized protein LOC111405758 [Olea europaea var. sylvestris]